MLWYKDLQTFIVADYTYNMSIYLGKMQGKWEKCRTVTLTHTKVESFIRRVEGVGHKLYIDNFLSLQIYLLTHTQELSAVVKLLDSIIKEFGDFNNKT
jgi:hypothetical protein